MKITFIAEAQKMTEESQTNAAEASGNHGSSMSAVDGHSTAYRYYVLFILFLVSAFNTIDKALVPVLAEPIKAEFNLSDTQLGLLVGIIFAVSYSLAAIPVSAMLDKHARTKVLASLLAIWSGLTALCTLATSYTTLVFARIGVAAAESGGNPGCMSLITDYFPKERRALAMSLFFSNNALGSMIAFALGGYIAATFGWRAAFLVFGVPGLILALMVLLTIKEPKRGVFDSPAAPSPRYDFRKVLATLLQSPSMLFLLLGVVCVVVAQSSVSGFIASFLIRVHGLPIDEAGYLVALAKGPAGIVGTLAGGVLADRLARGNIALGPLVIAIPLFVCAPVTILGLLAPDAYVAAALLGFGNFLNCGYYGAAFATYMTLAPPHMRGTLAGLLTLAATLFGYGVGAPTTGALSDLFSAWGAEHSLRWALSTTSLFFVAASLMFVAASRSIQQREARDPMAAEIGA